MKILLLPEIRFIISFFLRLRWNSSPEDTVSQQTGLYGYEVLRFQSWKLKSTCKCLICHFLLVLSVFLLLVLSFNGCIFLWEGASLYFLWDVSPSQDLSTRNPRSIRLALSSTLGFPRLRNNHCDHPLKSPLIAMSGGRDGRASWGGPGGFRKKITLEIKPKINPNLLHHSRQVIPLVSYPTTLSLSSFSLFW